MVLVGEGCWLSIENHDPSLEEPLQEASPSEDSTTESASPHRTMCRTLEPCNDEIRSIPTTVEILTDEVPEPPSDIACAASTSSSKLSDLADSKYPSISGPDEMTTTRIRDLHAEKTRIHTRAVSDAETRTRPRKAPSTRLNSRERETRPQSDIPRLQSSSTVLSVVAPFTCRTSLRVAQTHSMKHFTHALALCATSSTQTNQIKITEQSAELTPVSDQLSPALLSQQGTTRQYPPHLRDHLKLPHRIKYMSYLQKSNIFSAGHLGDSPAFLASSTVYTFKFGHLVCICASLSPGITVGCLASTMRLFPVQVL
ncbi:hypothetical protein C8Q76DRAFT_737963 [Earliella scabrosa]|nr:hypothetical protein C8Q76DRAFT_737963 [Earliella scabrosa]